MSSQQHGRQHQCQFLPEAVGGEEGGGGGEVGGGGGEGAEGSIDPHIFSTVIHTLLFQYRLED